MHMANGDRSENERLTATEGREARAALRVARASILPGNLGLPERRRRGPAKQPSLRNRRLRAERRPAAMLMVVHDSRTSFGRNPRVMK